MKFLTLAVFLLVAIVYVAAAPRPDVPDTDNVIGETSAVPNTDGDIVSGPSILSTQAEVTAEANREVRDASFKGYGRSHGGGHRWGGGHYGGGHGKYHGGHHGGRYRG